MIWSKEQRAVVAAVVLALSIVLGVVCWTRPSTVSDPQPIDGSRAAELVTKLDPNLAGAKDLSSIPGLGEKRAVAIVAYREMWLRHHPGIAAFRSMQDLTKVDGIGSATAANLQPYITLSPATGSR